MITNILHKALLATNKNNKFNSNNPLTFTAQASNSTIKLTQNGKPVVDGLQYRTNINNDWLTYTINTEIELTNVGDYVQFQNTNDQLSTSNSNYVQFEMTGKIAASGNIQSMLDYSYSCTDWCYHKMFYGCKSLISAPKLPATQLTEMCYSGMFYGCESLTTVPSILPATTLALTCYNCMFKRCTNLTVAPELPATELAGYCYNEMFYGCTNLNYVKVGFTDWTVTATNNWLNSVSPTGTFVCPGELDKTRSGSSYIPEGWSVNP